MEQRVPRSHGVWRVEKALAGFRRSGDRAEQRPPRSRHLLGQPLVSSDELERVAREYRHIHEDHRRMPPRSRARRRLDRRLEKLRQRFERLLAQAPISDGDRLTWHARLKESNSRAPSPDVRALLFRGRSAAGSELQLTACPGGTIAASVDDTPVAVLDDADELTTTTPGFVFTLDGRPFRETFEAPSAVLAGLRAALQQGRSPRREHLPELTGDGLVDRTGGLTARGRRALALDRDPARHRVHRRHVSRSDEVVQGQPTDDRPV